MVASSSNMPPDVTEDLTSIVWHDKQWLSLFPLNETTVLDYFSMSQFYDERCNNEALKMQKLDSSLLKNMAGIEYTLSDNPTPALFIITKSRRSLNPPSLEPLATYYIHDGNVYQAPSIHAILSSRFLQSVHHLRNAFETMHNATVLSSQGRYTWDPPPIPGEDKDDAAVHAAEMLSASEKRAVDRMLYDVLQKNRKIAAEMQDAEKNTATHASAQATQPTQTSQQQGTNAQ